jgi:hypothetical protein
MIDIIMNMVAGRTTLEETIVTSSYLKMIENNKLSISPTSFTLS